jgi:protein subunit release factor B
MSDSSYLEVTPSLRIPMAELDYRASRSGGPGGQHVNMSSTRVEVWWDVAGAPSLSEEQRALLLQRLANRLDSSGRLRLVSGTSRSQLRNREDVTSRQRSRGSLESTEKAKGDATVQGRQGRAAGSQAAPRLDQTGAEAAALAR